MTCEFCKVRIGTIQLLENRKGEQIYHHYCEVCARELLSRRYFLKDNFTELMTFLLESREPFLSNPQDSTHIACKKCGQTYKDFIQSSRFGCDKCYDVFGPLIHDKITETHYANTHKGKRPKNLSAIYGINSEISKNTLKDKGKENIEEYLENLTKMKKRMQVAYSTGDYKLVEEYDEMIKKL